MSRTTIADVAREAGVTKATVSHALSGNRPTSEETRAKVLAAAEKLHWVPSQSARALATSKANAVAVVLARDPSVIANDSFFPAFISGVESVLAETETALLLQVVSGRDAEERAYRTLSNGRADGALLLDLRSDDWRVPFLDTLGLPTVLVGAYEQPTRFSCVRTDDAAPVREIVAHLRAAGHERIAHISGPLDYVHSRARADAYTTAIGSDELLREGDFTAASGRDLTEELLAVRDRPTAILYSNDTMAIAGLSYARSQGLVIPRDLAISGFDDDHLSAHLSPALTSVSSDPAARGRAAARLLREDILGTPPRTEVVDCNVVHFRESTAPSASA
ncbi:MULTISPECIES: LacI family DNA-binding transcriptional regulator [unclassified Microbacterium]|uniref:LacI family DNA-binding transcriptional regulator n=1 Tax=unclassified Microbacterium TaxID=2609290 RepID=UPI000EA8930D|nr:MULTISPECIES: LacI family DNA-binding transcriptional regulator [unclassified Microbacterium]MBT2483942.1 LacI family DNA-binding transcriptional regulator [Microbacterium sp. ISL-108]RKN66911.1 LacI family transcriptional regulator [Microbacterium sp. CGR2]